MALAASGTVSLELALAQVPMVIAYKVTKAEEIIVRTLATAPSVVLPNLILGDNAIPQLLQDDCEPEGLAQAVIDLLDGPARSLQMQALQRVDTRMALPDGIAPSDRAARIVLSLAQ